MQTDLFGCAATVRRFDQDAIGFLVKYAKKHRGQSFSSEHVTLAAQKDGLAPQDLRAWGSVFSQAAREGYIRRSDVLFSRSMGNGSLPPGWVAK